MKSVLVFCFLLFSCSVFAQTEHGLLIGGGIGFENISINSNNPDFQKGQRFNSTYKYNLFVGYKFRFENQRNDQLFFDIDPLLRLQTLENETFFPGSSADYTSVTALAKDINFQLGVASSLNYKLFNSFFAGIGIEPTWNIVTEGKHFDIPILVRIGYQFSRKIELDITYRYGFLNTIDKQLFEKGRMSDVNLSIFIPF